MAAASFDIVAIGEPLYELNLQPGGRYLPGFGGDTLNVAIAAARLGARSAYITRLGDDIFGDALMDLMLRERIDVRGVARDRDAPTGLYFVTHGPDGHVFTYRRKDSAASRMTAEGFGRGIIAGARFLHASGISQAISATAAETVMAAIDFACDEGVSISYDTNFRPGLWSAADAWPNAQARTCCDTAVTTPPSIWTSVRTVLPQVGERSSAVPSTRSSFTGSGSDPASRRISIV